MKATYAEIAEWASRVDDDFERCARRRVDSDRYDDAMRDAVRDLAAHHESDDDGGSQ